MRLPRMHRSTTTLSITLMAEHMYKRGAPVGVDAAAESDACDGSRQHWGASGAIGVRAAKAPHHRRHGYGELHAVREVLCAPPPNDRLLNRYALPESTSAPFGEKRRICVTCQLSTCECRRMQTVAA